MAKTTSRKLEEMIKDPMIRQNDAIIQSSCDRRSLAVVAVWLRQQGYSVSSQSSVVRAAIEVLREILINHLDAEDIITSDDATDVLRFIGAGRVNPSFRGARTFVNKVMLEQDAFSKVLSPVRDLEKARRDERSQELTQNFSSALEEAKKLMQKAPTKEFRMPESVVDENDPGIQADIIRRSNELDEMKGALGAVPSGIIAGNTDNREEE